MFQCHSPRVFFKQGWIQHMDTLRAASGPGGGHPLISSGSSRAAAGPGSMCPLPGLQSPHCGGDTAADVWGPQTPRVGFVKELRGPLKGHAWLWAHMKVPSEYSGMRPSPAAQRAWDAQTSTIEPPTLGGREQNRGRAPQHGQPTARSPPHFPLSAWRFAFRGPC